MRTFAADIPGESKLVFTSRVPLGADLAIAVQEFTENEAMAYVRRLADAYSISQLKALPQDAVHKYLKRLHHKPLLIKWFALGVSSGLQPDSIVGNPDLALKFCLENVIDSLDEHTKVTALAFAVLPESHSATVIQYVTGYSATETEAAIATLQRYALIVDNSASSFERTYSMGPFARSYMVRVKPV